MSCIVCDHTMHSLGRFEDASRGFICPRCGTLKNEWSANHWSWQILRSEDAPAKGIHRNRHADRLRGHA